MFVPLDKWVRFTFDCTFDGKNVVAKDRHTGRKVGTWDNQGWVPPNIYEMWYNTIVNPSTETKIELLKRGELT